jgi:GT2 family glycosyltransferase
VDFMTFQFRLMRRELFERAGGIDETMAGAEDYDFCLRLSEICEFAHVPQALYFYRAHGSSTSSSKRIEQILASREAVQRALVRRGLAADYEIRVRFMGRFKLRRIEQGEDAPQIERT